MHAPPSDRSAWYQRLALFVSVDRLAVVCLVGTVFVLGMSGNNTEVWDGGYPYVAYEFACVDSDGNPVRGVQLEVRDERGKIKHHWPIDDFYPERVPISGQEGKLMFHCCGHRFGGTRRTYFYVIKTGQWGVPEYTCRFLHNGKLVAAVPFNELAFPPDSEITHEERTIRVPNLEHIFGNDPIPAADELPDTTHEFQVVSRSIVVPK